MSIECGECEHDLRGEHASDCSRNIKESLRLLLACIDQVGLIGDGANGNVHSGIDEGMVLTARAIEKARRTLAALEAEG